jgi:Na+/H+-translocating membrane pyrophosphatase
MKPGFSLNQILITAFLVAGAIAVGAVLSGYSGFIELQCSSEAGCRILIDGRPSESQ